MNKKTLLVLLLTLSLLIALAACDGEDNGYPSETEGGASAETQEEVPAAPADQAYPYPPSDFAAPSGTTEEAYLPPQPALEAESYPAEANTGDADPAQEALPADPVQEALPAAADEAYPAAEEAAYPAAEEAAYPAPEETAERSPSTEPEEEQGFLAEPAGSATLTNRIWTFQQFDDQAGQALLPASDLAEINTVEFFEDGRVSIIAGCNVARGSYAAVDGAINIQAANETQSICEDSSVGNQFLSWLNAAAAYSVEENALLLDLPDGAGEIKLQGSDILAFGDMYSKLLVMTASLGTPQPQPESIEELMTASLDHLVYQEGDPVNLAFGQAPGAVVLIQSPQGSMIQAAGLADVENGIGMSAYDRLEIGSNTKMLTAVLLAQLVEEGTLALDDTLVKWLPDLAESISYSDVITLRHLATHTSGIADYGDAVIGAGAADSEALRSAYTPEELVRIAIEGSPPDFAPGEPNRWNYSNTGYVLLGMILEAAGGQSYAELLQERIFDPLQMVDSTLLEGVPEPGSITQGYFVFPYDINTTEWNGTQGWAAGAIVSTAADMAKFARGLMTGALFQDPATRDVMTDFIDSSENAQVSGVGGDGYGLGLIEFAPGLWDHRGQTVGFTSIVAMDPDKDFVLIALTNSAEGATGDEQPMIGHFLELGE